MTFTSCHTFKVFFFFFSESCWVSRKNKFWNVEFSVFFPFFLSFCQNTNEILEWWMMAKIWNTSTCNINNIYFVFVRLFAYVCMYSLRVVNLIKRMALMSLVFFPFFSFFTTMTHWRCYSILKIILCLLLWDIYRFIQTNLLS